MTKDFKSNRVKDFATRINNLMNEQKQKGEDIKEVKKEADGEGYDAPTLMKAVRHLRKNEQKRLREQEQLELYLGALDGCDFSEE